MFQLYRKLVGLLIGISLAAAVNAYQKPGAPVALSTSHILVTTGQALEHAIDLRLNAAGNYQIELAPDNDSLQLTGQTVYEITATEPVIHSIAAPLTLVTGNKSYLNIFVTFESDNGVKSGRALSVMVSNGEAQQQKTNVPNGIISMPAIETIITE